MKVVETVLKSTLRDLSFTNQIEFKELSYDDSMMLFGSDKPDIRIPDKLVHIKNTEEMKVVYDSFPRFYVYRSLRIPRVGSIVSNSKLKQVLKALDGIDMQSLRVIRV